MIRLSSLSSTSRMLFDMAGAAGRRTKPTVDAFMGKTRRQLPELYQTGGHAESPFAATHWTWLSSASVRMFRAMRRALWFRPLALLVAVWLPLFIGEPNLLSPCPMHGAYAVASGQANTAHHHAGHASMAAQGQVAHSDATHQSAPPS